MLIAWHTASVVQLVGMQTLRSASASNGISEQRPDMQLVPLSHSVLFAPMPAGKKLQTSVAGVHRPRKNCVECSFAQLAAFVHCTTAVCVPVIV